MSPVIELKNINKFFGSHHVLRDVSLAIQPGNFYILLGKNGAGKSTLMRILMRFEQPDSGNGSLFGLPLSADRDGLNEDIGYVSEALEIGLPLRLDRLFSRFQEIYPRWDEKLFNGMLAELRVDTHRYFHDLSRGQKMQVAFAAAVAIHPKLLLLDEITAVLDANARAFFMDYLRRFTLDGGTVVMATNIVSEVQNYATHMVMLHAGRVSFDLPLEEVSGRYTKIRKQPRDQNPIFADPGCVEVCLNSDGSTSHILTNELSKKYSDQNLVLDNRGITAEEIFIYFTRQRTP